jgi:hypothetical protein
MPRNLANLDHVAFACECGMTMTEWGRLCGSAGSRIISAAAMHVLPCLSLPTKYIATCLPECEKLHVATEPLLPVVLGVMERLQVPSPHRPQILDSDRNQIA